MDTLKVGDRVIDTGTNLMGYILRQVTNYYYEIKFDDPLISNMVLHHKHLTKQV